MAIAEHLDVLKRGTPEWNRWRKVHPSIVPDLSSAHLQRVRLQGADLSCARLPLTYFGDADLAGANLRSADLSQAYLRNAGLQRASLERATLVEVDLEGADLTRARMGGADLRSANLRGANLTEADMSRVTLAGADLRGVLAVGTNLQEADLTGCRVYGIAAWNIELRGATQRDLLITPDGERVITMDNLAIAQFVYLLLHNERIRDVIETVGKKAILLLGRFAAERKPVLNAIRDVLREHNLIPILFDFEGPRNRDLTETISTLAHLSRAIVADITDPKSVPHELMAVIPGLPSVPVLPILAASAREYGTFEHFTRYPWVADVFHYTGPEELSAWLPKALAKMAPTE
jgi:hypothetical protein